MALILVVDDEYLISEILADMLLDEGHEVIKAAHGRAALTMAREKKPDLVISDFMMPLMTGLELTQAIRADTEIANTPVILLTGAQGHIARQHEDLFSAILGKPYRSQELLTIVSSLIEDTAPPKK